MKHEFSIEGMSCASCVRHIELAVGKVVGVESVQVNFATGKAFVEMKQHVSEKAIISAIHNAGYHANAGKMEGHVHAYKDDFLRFIISLIFTLPLLVEMVWTVIPGGVQAALATVVQFYGGYRMYKGTFFSLKSGSANMDVLIILGTTAAYLLSLVVLIFGLNAHLYFETSAVIITLVLFGRWLESRAKARASHAIEKLLKLQPKTAKVNRNGSFVEVPVEEIKPGDLFMVRPGENVPIDGVVVKGESTVNESMLTGESLPIHKGPKETVFAATNNLGGVLIAKATKVGNDTALAAIIRLVEQAQSSKAPIQRIADMVAGVFVPIVIVISIVTVTFWLIFGAGLTTAIINAVAVLVIACPCAIGLATPTVIVVASGKGASMGILFKEVAALERAKAIRTLILDKTGTITEGKPKVTDVVGVVLPIAYALEHNSGHPLAEAIVSYAEENNVKLESVEGFQSFSGKGVRGTINGKTYTLGSYLLAKEQNIALEKDPIETWMKDGKTIVIVWDETGPIGYIAIADQLKKTSVTAINALNEMGIDTLMLTGDHHRTAEIVAKQAGIKAFEAEVLPAMKAKKVEELKGKNLVGMVGDGINDAPALAAADVSFAIGAGSDVAIESADITLVRSDLMSVVDAILLSKATFKKIRQNLFFAFFYNILGIPLAAFGYLNPMVAAAAMAMSSVSVVSNALLLKRWSPHDR